MATHFKQVTAPDRKDPTKNRVYLTPCSPGDTGSYEKTWNDVDPDELLEPALLLSDFVKAVQNGKKSVNDEDVATYTKWTEEFGQEG